MLNDEAFRALLIPHKPDNHLLAIQFTLPKQQADHGFLIRRPTLRCILSVEKRRAPLARYTRLVHPDMVHGERVFLWMVDETGCFA